MISLVVPLIIAIVAQSTFARPLEGKGGLMVQGGNGNTLLDMHYEHIPTVLEKAAEEGKAANVSTTADGPDCHKNNEGLIVAEVLPEPMPVEEMVVLIDMGVEKEPARPELILPGLIDSLLPKHTPSPVEEALEAAEEMMENLKHTIPPNAEFDIKIDVDYPDKTEGPGLLDLISAVQPLANEMGSKDEMTVQIDL